MKAIGSFSGAIALIAVVLVAVISFGMVLEREAATSSSEARAIIEAKWELQNAHHLAGKSFADAIADSVFEKGCAFDWLDIETKAGNESAGYLRDALNLSLQNCQVANVGAGGAGPNSITLSFDIECTKELGNITVSYAKRGFAFDKRTDYYNDPALGCLVDVKDNGSLECDVDRIDTVATGIGCGS